MEHKKGDKFIIEIADVIKGHDNEEGPFSDPPVYYRIKGFNALFFDDNGLNKLKKISKEKEKIIVGDEVIVDGYFGTGVVTFVNEVEDEYCVMFYLGGTAYKDSDKLTKTGKHFDEIKSVLASLKKDSE